MLLVAGTLLVAAAFRAHAQVRPPAEQPAPADDAHASRGVPPPFGIDLPDFEARRHGKIGRRLHWNPEWPKFGWGGWISASVAGAAALTFSILGPLGSNRKGGIGPDEAIRDALRFSSLEDRRGARDASDIFLTSIVSYPLVDALFVAGWYRRSPEVAAQMALIDMQVFAVTLGVGGVVKSVVNRQRPYGRICGIERAPSTRDCDSNDLDYSFFSGHAAMSFAAASVNCAHHIWLGLYGSGWADGLSCAAGFAVATTTSVLRIVGDQHYFSDVLVGAAVGSLIGFGIPWLFHYRHGKGPKKGTKASEKRRDFQIELAPMPLGMGAVGTF